MSCLFACRASDPATVALPAAPSGRAPRIHARLRRLAT